MKARANSKKYKDEEVEEEARWYGKALMEEINAGREVHGKKPLLNPMHTVPEPPEGSDAPCVAGGVGGGDRERVHTRTAGDLQAEAGDDRARVCGGEGAPRVPLNAGIRQSETASQGRAHIRVHEFKEAGKKTLERQVEGVLPLSCVALSGAFFWNIQNSTPPQAEGRCLSTG